jgi:transposase InsO family protein
MKLYINMLLERINANPDAETDRVLWVSEAGDEVVLIRLCDKKANPLYESYSELIAELERGELKVLEVDPYAPVAKRNDEVPAKHLKVRDRAWQVIEPIIQLPRDGQFLRSERGPIITRLVREKRAAKSMIYGYLRRYWQGGQVKNALFPEFSNCGAPGKLKPDTSAKRGCPRKFADSAKAPGVNVSDETRRLFKLGIEAFYENPKNPTKMTLREAYNRTIARFFHRGYEWNNGSKVPALPAATSLPSFNQFVYWYRKEQILTKSLIARDGKRKFNLKHRALGGDAASIAPGPGAFFQIDATPGDVHLVSSLNHGLIGRPDIYLVVDVFSRLITGFSATLETSSFVSAMLAVENATCDKAEFCAKHGIQISEREWPSHHLPDALLADRGELLSKNASQLADGLNIRVSNTGSYRPDFKPFVERMHRSLKDELISHLPGAILKEKERGERDPRLDAALTLPEFRRLMIAWILDHNRKRIEGMRARDFMVSHDVEPRPIDLWEWGIAHRSGCLRIMDRNIIKLHLLPAGEASVTAMGIRFNRLLYSCERALRKEWYVRARHDGSRKVDVAFDPRDAGVLFLRPTTSYPFEECRLRESDSFYSTHSWADVKLHLSKRFQQREQSLSADMQQDAAFRATLDAVVSAAKKRAQVANKGKSKAERLRGLTENRQAERDLERQATRAPIPAGKADNIIPITSNGSRQTNDEGYVPRPSNLDMLKKQREELWNNHEKTDLD